MKKAALILSLVLMTSVTAYAHGGQHIRLYQNYDEEIQTLCPLVEKNGTLYMGARDFCGFACGDPDGITWIDEAKMGYIGSLNARIYAGTCEYQLLGQKYTSAQPAEIIDGRLMIPLETATAMAGSHCLFDYDAEDGTLQYLCPRYEFANVSSDYRMDIISVDLKGDDFSLLEAEIKEMAAVYGGFGENDELTVKSVIEVTDGNGTVVFSVTGDNAREITVQVRNGYAVKVCDPFTVTVRADGSGLGAGLGNGAGMGNGYHHGWN